MSVLPPSAAQIPTIGYVKAKPYVPPPQAPEEYQYSHEMSSFRVVVEIQNRRYFVTSVSVVNNAHGASDSAEITMPLSKMPDFTQMLARSDSNTTIVPVQVYVGIFQSQPPVQNFDISGLTLLFSGQVDMYSMTYHDDEITFNCRSLASVLIDNRLTGIQQNLKTTDFVKAIAKQYNLTANILLPVNQYKMSVAEVYAQSFAIGIQNWRIWDMLLKMAEFDGADVWVVGSTLNYVAPQLIKRNIIDLKYGRDIETITVQHSPLYSKNIRVEVRSYTKKNTIATTTHVDSLDDGDSATTRSTSMVSSNPIFGTKDSLAYRTDPITGAVTLAPTQLTHTGGSFAAAAGTGPLGENGPLRYTIYAPGLAPAAVDLLAQATWARLSRHEYSATIGMPLTRALYKTLLITSKIRLHGLPTRLANNDNYWPRRITVNIDVNAGASVSIEAISIKLPAGEV